ncbi:hypothetical protein BJV82DRAFT_523463 [Fennellomyces sp. T-0311]|nr:hypothetical protein BJV82DRAFT_523463 [Fennellomyces sp. T-0311]
MSQRIRKRDQIKNALRSATDQWKEKHGWSSSTTLLHQASSSSSPPKVPVEQGQDEEPLPPLPVNPAQRLTLPPIEHDVWQVAKHASVCTLLVMSKKEDTEKLALATLEYGMKASSGTTLVLRELLLRPWIENRSALDWAIQNDCQIFLSDARVQAVINDSWKFYGPTDWQDVPDHPCAVWKTSRFNSNFFTDYLARWAAPRYQAWVGLICGLVYLGLHLATVGNREYTSDMPFDFEYAYYFFVASDLVLELYKVLIQPVQAVKRPSTYLSILTAALLFTSMVLRFVALDADTLEKQQFYLILSFDFLVWATPLMIFRLVLWSDNLCWQVAKARHLVSQCIVDALWVMCLGVVTVIAFWIGLAALQHDDMDCLTMLRHLALGALHAPEIGGTLYYQPQSAGLMLFAYLFLIIVVIGTLLTASFLTTMMVIYPRIDSVQRLFLASRCAKKPAFGVFLPTILIELILGVPVLILVYVFKQKNDSISLTWIERIRQVFWFIVYLPVILMFGIVEGICSLYEMIRHRLSGYHLLK